MNNLSEEKYAIELKEISKIFGSVIANDNINLAVKRGEILALLGENGSGKTTLMNMLSGIYKPDKGEIYLNGSKINITSPEDSKNYGIGMVHQHFKLVEKFSATDNIWIGAENESKFLSNSRYEKIEKICSDFGFSIDPRKKIHDMSVSEKQTVEILKVLYYGADILILDEPTAVLTTQEIRKLFSILRKLKENGCAIIIITHKLNEVLEISDRVTILRKGKSIGTVITKETNAKELTDMMVGKTTNLEIERPEPKDTKILMEIKDLCIKNEEKALAIDNVSFELKAGEILGVAGVSGCGQKELCEALAGLQEIESGSIIYKDENIEGLSPREIIKRGISMSFIPEDRLGMGLAASLSITDNMILKNYIDGKGPFVNRKSAKENAEKVIDELEVSTPNTQIPVRRLSGGNVQKILIGREILINPNVIITAYPVRGLDINSSYTVYNILNEQKKKNVAIMFIGEDLDVMLKLCDRIMVLCHGRVTGIVNAKQTNKEELGLLMTDARSKELYTDRTENKLIVNNENDLKEETAPPIIEKERTIKNKHAPLLRITKRKDLKPWQTVLMYLIAVIIAIFAGGLFIAVATDVSPIEYYTKVVLGCFSQPIYINGFIRIIIPLTITSLGVAIAFKMRFWNLGGNGQFIAGAVFAAAAATLLPETLSSWIAIPIVFLAGALGGSLLGFIPAILKVKFGTNETLLTLMFNYITAYILVYLKKLKFFGMLTSSGVPNNRDFAPLAENSHLPQITIGKVSFDISLIIAVLLVILVYIYFKKTKHGYEISVVGDSPSTARYAGMNVNKIIVRTMILSAAIIGIAGMLQVSSIATSYTLSDKIASDVGWTAIIVAWLAKLNPFGILVTSSLLGILQKGSAVAESAYKISSATSEILQGIILFTVLAADFFIRYKIVLNIKKAEKINSDKTDDKTTQLK